MTRQKAIDAKCKDCIYDEFADGRAGVAYPTADARSDQARRLAASHRKGGLYCLYPYTLTELDLLVIY